MLPGGFVPTCSSLQLTLHSRPVWSASVPAWPTDYEETWESDGGQFPSHPGRPGPETSSEGAHLMSNPQEIQAGFSSCTPPISLPPSHHSFPSCFVLQAEKPCKFKASVRARANPRVAFPRARADEILFFARKNDRGRGRTNRK